MENGGGDDQGRKHGAGVAAWAVVGSGGVCSAVVGGGGVCSAAWSGRKLALGLAEVGWGRRW